MRQLTIALGVLQQGEHYLLQQRGDDPKIGGAGLIGCFGGKLEDGEHALAAVMREIHEETTLRIRQHDLRHVGRVQVVSDHQLEPVEVLAHVFHHVVDTAHEVEALEGELIKWTKAEVMANLDRLTTGTRAVFVELF